MDFIELYYYFCRVVLRDFMPDFVALAEVLRLFCGTFPFRKAAHGKPFAFKIIGKISMKRFDK